MGSGSSVTPFEAVLRRDRVVVAAGLAVLAALGWAYMVYLARGMSTMGMSGAEMGAEMGMPGLEPWGLVDFWLMFVMWAVMMVAMMVPSAAPLVLMVAKVNRQRDRAERPLVPTGLFLLGYLIAWTGFSVVATLAQWALESAALLSPMMVASSPVLGGLLLLAAGVFQLTPLKHACLTHCRSPVGFVMSHWREGPAGALRMGLEHGVYCVGCCWVLMALLFLAGVMNLLWIAAISIFVLGEKLLPRGDLLGRGAGVAFAVAGVVLLAGGW